MKLTHILILTGLFCCHALLAQTAYTIETIPNIKLVNNSYVSNPDGILLEGVVAQIDRKLGDLEKETTVQAAVVAVNSIGSADILDFAEGLFNLWGIGHAQKDNGLLILLVMDQRTVRFQTGYGLEGVLPDALCKKIQRDQMVPSFEGEDYNQGMLDGVSEVVHVLSNPSYREELTDISNRESDSWDEFFVYASVFGGALILFWYLALLWSDNFSDSKKNEKKLSQPEMKIRQGEWLLIFCAGPVGLLLVSNSFSFGTGNHILIFLLAIYLYLSLTLFYRRIRMSNVINRMEKSQNYATAVAFMAEYQVFWLVMGILFPFPWLLLYVQYNSKKRFLRNHPRNCKSCNQPVQKLDEVADDQYLKQSQVFEENLHSVDYDVWLCQSCKSTEVLTYTNRFSKYEPCPYCKTKSFYTESNRTIVSATYESTGRGEKTQRCKFCKKSKVSSYTIPQRTRSDSDSSSSSGSSGGSWGGGSSGGGGASSSW